MNIHPSLNFICLISLLIFISCNDTKQDRSNTAVDSTQNLYIDSSLSKKNSDSLVQNVMNGKLNPIEEEQVKEMERRKREKDEMKKLYGPGYTSGNEIEISESKILYNDDFSPYLMIKVKNNLIIPFVAFQIIVYPKANSSSGCDPVFLKKKMILNPNAVATLKIPLDNAAHNCTYDDAKIELGICIMSNGKRLVMNDFLGRADGIGDEK